MVLEAEVRQRTLASIIHLLGSYPFDFKIFPVVPFHFSTMGSVSKTVGIIVTSNRAVRLGPSVGALVHSLLEPAAQAASIILQTVEVRNFDLPVYEGPVPPKFMASQGLQYEPATSPARRWADAMAALDGYVFVVNEYNGMSGATKNALDYLYAGFVGKPAAVVSYGGFGGGLANAQTRAVLGRMGLTVVEPAVELALAGNIGPDMFLGVNEGRLGEASRKLWTTDKAGELLQAFGQLEKELSKEETPIGGEEGDGGSK